MDYGYLATIIFKKEPSNRLLEQLARNVTKLCISQIIRTSLANGEGRKLL